MVKVDFFKKYSKPLALLAILIILSIVLFSSVNDLSVENFLPKSNAVLEIMLFTNNGSPGNKFVTSEWLDIVNTYKNFPNIKFGQGNFEDYKKYITELMKMLSPKEERKITDEEFEKGRQGLPMVFMSLMVDNKLAAFPMMFASSSLTTLEIKKNMGAYISTYYDKLYSNASTSTPSLPKAIPAMPGEQEPAQTQEPAKEKTQSWMKFPGT